MNCCDLFK